MKLYRQACQAHDNCGAGQRSTKEAGTGVRTYLVPDRALSCPHLGTAMLQVAFQDDETSHRILQPLLACNLRLMSRGYFAALCPQSALRNSSARAVPVSNKPPAVCEMTIDENGHAGNIGKQNVIMFDPIGCQIF